MHNFGDVVKFTKNGEESNAIVLYSRSIENVEHLCLSYPNKAVAGQMMTAQNVAKAMLVAFDVLPLAEGGINGWHLPAPPPPEMVVEAADSPTAASLVKSMAVPGPSGTGDLPSAADLDAAAALAKAKAETEAKSDLQEAGEKAKTETVQ